MKKLALFLAIITVLVTCCTAFGSFADGELVNLFDSSKVSTEFSKTQGDDNEMSVVYGKVVKKFSDSINVTVNGQTAQNYSTTNATVLKLDTTKTTNKVSVADTGEISKWEDGANEERVFIRIYKDEVKEFVIVK